MSLDADNENIAIFSNNQLMHFKKDFLVFKRQVKAASSAQFKFNDNLLSLTQNNSGKGYYGNQQLYYNGLRISFDKAGPIHDFCFFKEKFIVCYGNLPSFTSIFDKNGEKLHMIAEGFYNFIKQKENILILGGLGNLKGEIDIYGHDTEEKKAQQTITKSTWGGTNVLKFDSPASINEDFKLLISEPISCPNTTEIYLENKHIVCATLHKRLKVDNMLSVFSIGGKRLFQQQFKRLDYCIEEGTMGITGTLKRREKKNVEKKKYVPPSKR